MQQWIDRRYRYVWSNKKEPPLKTMQRIKHNMQDLRNSLQINTLQWKIEQRSLQRIGHVMRLDNSRPVKRAMTGWLPALETIPKEKTKIRTTPHYWNRLVKEAGVNPTQIDYLTSDRKKWRSIVRERMKHLSKWEYQQGNQAEITEQVDSRNIKPAVSSRQCQDCNMTCKSAAGLSIHRKRMHTQTTITFTCAKCLMSFKSENTKLNHMKTCQGEIQRHGNKQCTKCFSWISAPNFSRHRAKCCPKSSDNVHARKYVCKYVPCPVCKRPTSATNLARHLRTCRNEA